MSNIGLIIEERSRDIGDFLVGRILPFREKRMVGPFIFIDHMGPSEIGPGHYMDVGQHPHIGLSTLTYLLEGEMVHRDSVGSVQRISPGAVNWMTAGHGVVHTERTPEDLRDGKTRPVHGLQIWVALPKSLEQMAPEFHHIPEEELPSWEEAGTWFTLVAGEGFGRKSPVPVHSPLFMVEIKTNGLTPFVNDGHVKGEIGILVLEGYIEACGERIEAGRMLVGKEEEQCNIMMGENSHIFLFGGEAFPEKRYIWWNFVASSQELIDDAKERWRDGQFEWVPGETGYIKLPER